MTTSLILASTSRYRKMLLERLGRPFEAVAPPYDEEAGKRAHAALGAAALSQRLGREKALSVSRLYPDAWVIGSDQIATLDGARLDKPGTADAAVAQLVRLSGKTHQLVTSVTVVRAATGYLGEATDVHALTMRALDAATLRRYVEADAPLDCAGSYRVEARGIALFETIRGDDFTAVIGLPLTKVVALLEAGGYPML
ncbi:MAG: septum formation protein Maf [Myxococcales bacterium]|nr:septum formation protein Maf [Myxococcales bacterium]